MSIWLATFKKIKTNNGGFINQSSVTMVTHIQHNYISYFFTLIAGGSLESIRIRRMGVVIKISVGQALTIEIESVTSYIHT